MSATLDEALRRAGTRLAEAGVDSARLDARVLLCHALGCAREALVGHGGRRLDAETRQRFETLIARRAAREPVAYITGEREFWSLPFAVTRATLSPRPETETVVAAVLDRVARGARPRRLLDLGTGSGCLLLALLAELPEAAGVGVDASEAAVRVARDNAARLGLTQRATFIVGDWTAPIGARFDAIVANPPYVASGAIAALAPEVATYEPRLALDGGPDGLTAYRAIARSLSDVLDDGGLAAFEVGAGQATAVVAMLAGALPGTTVIETVRDLAQVERCVVARRRTADKI